LLLCANLGYINSIIIIIIITNLKYGEKKIKKRPYDTVLCKKYRGCVYRWQKLLVDSRTIFEENLISANNVGTFYRYVNQRITSNSSTGIIVDHCGAQLTDSVLKSNA